MEKIKEIKDYKHTPESYSDFFRRYHRQYDLNQMSLVETQSKILGELSYL